MFHVAFSSEQVNCLPDGLVEGCRYSTRIYMAAVKCFDLLPVAGIVAGKIFAIHGGLSPRMDSIQVRTAKLISLRHQITQHTYPTRSCIGGDCLIGTTAPEYICFLLFCVILQLYEIYLLRVVVNKYFCYRKSHYGQPLSHLVWCVKHRCPCPAGHSEYTTSCEVATRHASH